MNPEVIAAIVSAIGVVGAAMAWGIRYIAKNFIEFLKELKPNGGSSLKDQVTRVEVENQRLNDRMDALDTKIDILINAFNDYIKSK